jgi:hypothetical protein
MPYRMEVKEDDHVEAKRPRENISLGIPWKA